MFLPPLQRLAAFYANAFLRAVLIGFVGNTCGFAAAGANNLNLAGIHCAFGLDNTALLAHFTGLHMLADHIAAFYNDLALFGADSQYFTLLAAILTI